MNAFDRRLHGVALAVVVLCPWLLLHARAGVEIAYDLVDVGFLAYSAWRHDWAWLRRHWVLIGLAWWGWQALCSLPLGLHPTPGGGRSAVQAILVVRFLIFAAALEHWVLPPAWARRWLLASLAAATVYVVLQTLMQFVTGHNLFGDGRASDGELTGPFREPRDAPTYVRMLFPPLLPAIAALTAWRSRWRAAGYGLATLLAIVAIATLVLIGQRMPVLLGALGIVVAGLLQRRLRPLLLVALVAGGALVAASAVLSPPAFYRLVTKFSRQMSDWPDSPYGQIAARAVAIAEHHPIAGLGFNGFELGCPQPAYFQGWHYAANRTDQGGGAAICVTHPHSHYLQALTDAGLPGLILFGALVLTWLVCLGRGLWRAPDPLRTGLFIAALIQEWPIASTSPLISVPIGAWFFLLLGFGLAEAAAAPPPPRPLPARRDRPA